MIEHEDEFFNQFEVSDLLHDHEYDVDNEANPFLLISLHVVAETQLEIRDPIEVYQFYNAMRAKKCSHHDTPYRKYNYTASCQYTATKKRI